MGKIQATEQPQHPPLVIVDYISKTIGPEAFVLLSIASLYLFKYIIQPRINRITGGFNRTLKLEELLSGLLYRILECAKADRVTLSLPSNGTIYAVNFHSYKISDIKEAVRVGISSIKDSFQDVPVENLTELLNSLIASKYIVNPDMKFAGQSEKLKNYYVEGGVKSTIHVFIGSGKEFIGFVAVHYNQSQTEDFLLNKKSEITELVNQIESLLSNGHNILSNIINFITNSK